MLFFNETLGEMIMFLQQLVTGISVGGIYALLATGYSLIYNGDDVDKKTPFALK